MAIPMDWKSYTTISQLLEVLGITLEEFNSAVRESKFNYVERDVKDKGRPRHLCYPTPGSTLRKVLDAIKAIILYNFDLLPNVRGYTKGAHNINVSSELCPYCYVGNLDISKYHPSITVRHVAVALRKHGLTWQWTRQIARLITYKGHVPQGAPTSNHIANLVMDTIFRRWIVPFALDHNAMVVNYGDDIAFMSNNAEVVRKCVKFGSDCLNRCGFMANDKGRECEHRGAERLFIGCSTGRSIPDLPRKKYRLIRKDLRRQLQKEIESKSDKPVSSEKRINSIRHKIAYVIRLNPRKARRLKDIYFRICAARREKLRKIYGVSKVASVSSSSLQNESVMTQTTKKSITKSNPEKIAPWE
jgi:hypothetical protein